MIAAAVEKKYDVGIVGGGPAGTGTLFAALQKGVLPELLDRGVALFESGNALGNGRLGDFRLNSDTLSDSFLEILDNDPSNLLSDIEQHSATRSIARFRGRACPLPVAGEFVRCLGDRLLQIFQRYGASNCFLNTTIESAQRTKDGSYLIKTSGPSPSVARCRKLIIATGGSQNRMRAISEPVLGGACLENPEFQSKAKLTDPILRGDADAWLAERLARPNCRVVVLGASHSAFSVAWYLLQKGFPFGVGGIQIFHRSRPKVYFGSAQAAINAGYHEFDDRDFCPLTKRLYRLAGLRFDGRRLLMQMWQLDGEGPEPRVQLQALEDVRDNLDEMLNAADVIVPAFGYCPKALELFDASGERIPLRADAGGPLVDDDCRVLSSTGKPLPNVYGIGLASGFIPSGKLGGEPSFKGQTNGYWLYQNGVGEIILDALLANVTNRKREDVAL